MTAFFQFFAHYKFCIQITALTVATITLPDLLFATAALKLAATALGALGVAIEVYKKNKKK